MAICNNKKCSLGECDQPETCAAYVPVLTRADKIRAMSDDELTDFLNHWADFKAWKRDPGATKDWLQQPAKTKEEA